MHNRYLTKARGHVLDLDVFIKDNVYDYDGWVSGFSRDKDLSKDILMEIQSNIILQKLYYLRAKQIYLNSIIGQLTFVLEKITKFENKASVYSVIDLLLEKQVKLLSLNELLFTSKIILLKQIQDDEINMYLNMPVLELNVLKSIKTDEIQMVSRFSQLEFKLDKSVTDGSEFEILGSMNILLEKFMKSLSDNELIFEQDFGVHKSIVTNEIDNGIYMPNMKLALLKRFKMKHLQFLTMNDLKGLTMEELRMTIVRYY